MKKIKSLTIFTFLLSEYKESTQTVVDFHSMSSVLGQFRPTEPEKITQRDLKYGLNLSNLYMGQVNPRVDLLVSEVEAP